VSGEIAEIEVLRGEIVAIVREHVRRLPGPERAVIESLRFRGETYAQAGRSIGVETAGAVYKTLERALGRLTRSLSADSRVQEYLR
jgi:DNA-directed RNA polymerase specialized sigma24 family protein